MTLARDWDFRDVTGYYWSEKFDGCRAYWDGFAMWTRGGNAINLPTAIVGELPVGIALDGEIWCGRGGYIEAMNAVRHNIWTDNARFVVFDAPDAKGNWLQRMKSADAFAGEYIQICKRGKIQYRDHASELAAEIIDAGGEGIMLRSPFVKSYERKRTCNLMRIKKKNLYAPWHGYVAPKTGDAFTDMLYADAEAVFKVERALSHDI